MLRHTRTLAFGSFGIIGALCITLFAGRAQAQTDTWLGSTNFWNTATNWSPTGVPNNGDILIYNGGGGTSTNDTSTVTSIGGITFTSGVGAYTLTSTGAGAHADRGVNVADDEYRRNSRNRFSDRRRIGQFDSRRYNVHWRKQPEAYGQ